MKRCALAPWNAQVERLPESRPRNLVVISPTAQVSKMGSVRFVTWIGAMLAVVGSCLAHAPEPRKNDFFKIETAGLMADRSKSGNTLVYAFMFVLKKSIKVTRVRVEDVSDKAPALLAGDTTPKISGGQWRGKTSARPLTPDNYPWMFDTSDSRRSFRVTVSTLDNGDIVLVQPAKFYAPVKKLMIQIPSRRKKKDK
jgi:hypothetical protein